DLAVEEDMAGIVTLYDIDKEAAHKNVLIGNAYESNFTYETKATLSEALQGANFVVISILPGTFDEMESDVHLPEKYGIYQSVGDTTGPGGILRALRTLPMYVEIANAIKENAPDAWVINYTNPMSACVRILYEVFPQIKAFGCCHEVFGTQELLAYMVQNEFGIEKVQRDAIKVNVQGVNHFTWLNEASYDGHDLMPVYAKYAKQFVQEGIQLSSEKNWLNNHFACANCVKFDLFNRFGVIAAAGDRHLAEFCPGWYLKNPQTANSYKFSLTPVSWRKDNLVKLLAESERKSSGAEKVKIKTSGEDGVRQMKALLGLGAFITNVNLPNYGQIDNLEDGTVVETNAVFSQNSVKPVCAGAMDENVLQLTLPHVYLQKQVVKACMEHSVEPAFKAFAVNPLVTLPMRDARKLFDEMLDNTKEYLENYHL
ncbi:MAG: alpha-glucosidase/alpha-galactosidase, partial [Ruthenibacterium sp.]